MAAIGICLFHLSNRSSCESREGKGGYGSVGPCKRGKKRNVRVVDLCSDECYGFRKDVKKECDDVGSPSTLLFLFH